MNWAEPMGNRKSKGRSKEKAAKRIPILTETVVLTTQSPPLARNEQETSPFPVNDPLDTWPDEQMLAELRSSLTTQTIDLASQLLHGAVREMEAALLEQVLDRLRQELPGLIDGVLNEQLESTDRSTGKTS
jgi:hypothetical protein